MKLVAVTGFGSVWRRRYGRGAGSGGLASAAYYNTTGVPVNGVIRTRPKIAGHIRFNGVGGFNSNYPSRRINRVFDCAEPCLWHGQTKVLFKAVLSAPVRPDSFLVVVKTDQIGHLEVGAPGWKSDNSLLISFSEHRDQQETMLLMSSGSWVRSSLGHVVLTPCAAKPWIADLRLTPHGR